MSYAVFFGRLIFALVWGAMLANFIWPFPGKAYAVFIILFAVLLSLHALQTLLFIGVYKQHVEWRRSDYLQILLFGVIGWLAIMQAQPSRREATNPEG
ncbi:DUF1145 domain-containing protein [Pseudidiomarina taiwanensis]|uniref:DUF1145 domain-containing protein n=1 Tax=Pseudidiomarina taiwanensis TaxID=337250 RepID=A0A432ZL70_9GAMM|nr:DUF1145 domain-containing protein [Pseudidiomarina taiwanensis]RUO78689.1 DUF1145 domain-containing protein [Pseudidiomarina taiwanensis]